MSLNPRQRTKVNAALSRIALHGHNPRTVQQAAKAHIAKGVADADAYSDALNAFASTVPAMRETLATILELVQHSDAATLGQYDAAIDQFNQTGDNSALTALEPMIVEDFKALIVKQGLASPEDAAALDFSISDALALSDEAVSPEPWAPSPAEINAQAPQEAPQEGAASLSPSIAPKGAQEGNPNMSTLTPPASMPMPSVTSRTASKAVPLRPPRNTLPCKPALAFGPRLAPLPPRPRLSAMGLRRAAPLLQPSPAPSPPRDTDRR